MPKSAATGHADWYAAICHRRSVVIPRLVVGIASAMFLSPILGAMFSAIWVAAYALCQVIEIQIFRPITAAKPQAIGRGRTILGCLMLSASTAIYCFPAIPLWNYGGAMGGIAATIMLLAAILFTMMNSGSSLRLLVCMVTPEFVILGTTPFFMAAHGASKPIITTVGIALVLFSIYSLVSWQKLTLANRATERARSETDIKLRRAEDDAAQRAAYLAAIAHDLRTPIGAILTGASELDAIVAEGGGRNQTALIKDAGLMMKALLDDLMDHSRLEAGAMSIEIADFNLRTLMAQTVRLWSGPIRAKGMMLRLEGAHQIPAMVRGDAMRLRQVLNNLISNAIKFTDTGSITLRLKAWVEEPQGHALLIEIADTGPGMKPEQLVRLFNPFDQTEEGVSAKHGGSGLGLNISRNLVHLMGGRLVARSVYGQGASFTISVIFPPAFDTTIRSTALEAQSRADVTRALRPVARSEATPVVTPETRPHRGSVPEPVPAPTSAEMPDHEQEADEGRALRVLVVDDHDINRRAIELILAPLGCEIASASNGLAALDLSATQAFDVIFMDVRMPELDGRETTRRLRAGGGLNADAPVIAVTADTSEDDIAACMAAGMTYFVSKPLTPATLLGALQFVLANGAQEAEVDTIAA